MQKVLCLDLEGEGVHDGGGGQSGRSRVTEGLGHSREEFKALWEDVDKSGCVL